MNIDSSWDKSAGQYINMYSYGMLVKQWKAERKKLIEKFTKSLKQDQDLFAEFFIPGQQEYGDTFDWQLKESL